jgi:branched-chain amino acid transport system ATP-binding protein
MVDLFSVQGVSVARGRRDILHEVSLRVGGGEFVSLIGNNGVGKTTLMLTLSGILRAHRGSIVFDGRPIERNRPHEIVSMGLVQVAQGRQLFAGLTVFENLEIGGRGVRGGTAFTDRLDRVYTYFPRLRERPKQLAGTLSGGEQQMLAIARAMMGEPRLLLLDEPSDGLAPTVVDVLADVITTLHEQGLTILLVEQNAYLALELADRAYVMEGGRIIEEGPTADLIGSEMVRRAYLGV